MPHQFMGIQCKKCGRPYCPICDESCPNCGEVDIADQKTEGVRRQMREYWRRIKKEQNL